MDYFLICAILLHVVSRKLLLWKIVFDKNARGVSLVTQECFLVLYVCRYLDLLYLYTSLGETLIKIAHLMVALAIVLLIRFNSNVAYDADLDTAPRWLILVPTLVLALVFNKVSVPRSATGPAGMLWYPNMSMPTLAA